MRAGWTRAGRYYIFKIAISYGFGIIHFESTSMQPCTPSPAVSQRLHEAGALCVYNYRQCLWRRKNPEFYRVSIYVRNPFRGHRTPAPRRRAPRACIKRRCGAYMRLFCCLLRFHHSLYSYIAQYISADTSYSANVQWDDERDLSANLRASGGDAAAASSSRGDEEADMRMRFIPCYQSVRDAGSTRGIAVSEVIL